MVFYEKYTAERKIPANEEYTIRNLESLSLIREYGSLGAF
jgi:hypothetical protein